MHNLKDKKYLREEILIQILKNRLFDVDIKSRVFFCFQHETRGSGSGSNEYDLAAVVVHHGSGYVFLNI